MTLYQVNLPQGDVDGKHVMHSSEQYKTHPDCAECKSIANFEANPPTHGPTPTVYTEADLCDGPDALLEALRREYAAYDCDPRLGADKWKAYERLAIVTRDVTHTRKGFDYAERGDAVLVKPGTYGEDIKALTGRDVEPALRDTVSVWCPRIRGTVLMDPEWLRYVVAVEDLAIGSPAWEAAFAAKRREMYGED